MNHFIEPARAPDALAALRAATASRHQLLDSGLAVGADDASLSDYTAHLGMLRAWLAPLASWLDGFSDGPQAAPAADTEADTEADTQAAVHADMQAWLRARLALIDADLRAAGIEPGALPAAPARAWPPAASAAYRWGVCYVVEGSQLGGAVLYQRLRARLAPHPLAYLRGDPAGPGPRWRRFMQALRAQLRTPAQVADACAGACAGFDRILAAGLARDGD